MEGLKFGLRLTAEEVRPNPCKVRPHTYTLPSVNRALLIDCVNGNGAVREAWGGWGARNAVGHRSRRRCVAGGRPQRVPAR